MHFKDLARLFNISNLFVYTCLLLFSILLSLRVSEIVSWHLAIVFLPLWLWNTVLLVGLTLGIGCWIKRKNARYGREQKVHLAAMLQTATLHLPLFITEMLVVFNAESADPNSWTAIFTPIYFLSILSIASCIMSCYIKHCRVEFELISIASVLQLLFIGLRLDGLTNWTWAVVLAPTWVSLIMLVIGLVIYGVVRCCLALAEEEPESARLAKHTSTVLLLAVSLATGCFILFMALLSARLDELITSSYATVFIPLHLSLLFLMVTTVTRGPANPWWLGLGKNLMEFILDSLPFLQEYANISQRADHDDDEGEVQLIESDPTEGHYDNLLSVEEPVRVRRKTRASAKKALPVQIIPDNVYPYENIYEPD